VRGLRPDQEDRGRDAVHGPYRWHLVDNPYGRHRIGVSQYTGYSLIYRSFELPYVGRGPRRGLGSFVPLTQGQPEKVPVGMGGSVNPPAPPASYSYPYLLRRTLAARPPGPPSLLLRRLRTSGGGLRRVLTPSPTHTHSLRGAPALRSTFRSVSPPVPRHGPQHRDADHDGSEPDTREEDY
jgi:hypothetical protein